MKTLAILLCSLALAAPVFTVRSSPACQLYDMHRNGQIKLFDNNGHFNITDSYDRADARSNIEDACEGRPAKRSRCCGRAGIHCPPGGREVRLSDTLLQYILNVAESGQYVTPLQINVIAGTCFKTNSYHYYGSAVDIQIKAGDKDTHPPSFLSNYEAWMTMCSNLNPTENLGPGDPNHDTHTHCAFPVPYNG